MDLVDGVACLLLIFFFYRYSNFNFNMHRIHVCLGYSRGADGTTTLCHCESTIDNCAQRIDQSLAHSTDEIESEKYDLPIYIQMVYNGRRAATQ